MIKKENIKISSIIPRIVYKKLVEEAEYEDRSISNMVCKILKERYKIRDSDEWYNTSWNFNAFFYKIQKERGYY